MRRRRSDAFARVAARAIAYAAWCLFGVQPLLAAAQATLPIVPDRKGGAHPVVGVSASGVPLINITTPNRAGVSMNRFSQYNVGTQGAVIVNSGRQVLTNIAGWVQGNPFVGNTPARLIVNQVTSGNPTRLLGPTEIAGARANLVIANPAGITCAGCGFINASRISLVTGVPNFNHDGSLGGFSVTHGRIGISGAGLDARSSAIDLIARAMTINAQIWAGSVEAVAGANRIAYETHETHVQGGEGGAPRFAIDVQALGSMFADSVRLIGTEAGVGVRDAGTLTSLTGEIRVSANGEVTIEPVARVQSAGNTRINGADVVNHGALISAQATEITAGGQLSNAGTVAAARKVEFGAASIHNSGQVFAGVDRDGALSEPGSIDLRAPHIGNSGMLAAGADVKIVGEAISLDRGTVSAAHDVRISGEASVSNVGGTIDARYATLASGGALHNEGGAIDTRDGVRVEAKSLSNRSGRLSGDALSLTVAKQFDNSNGEAVARQGVQIAAVDVLNEDGRIGARGETVGVHASGTVSNVRGKIVAGKSIDLNAHALSNAGGTMVSNAAELKIGDALNNSGGTLAAMDEMQIDAASVSNRGGMIGSVAGALTVTTSGAIDNAAGQMLAHGDIGLAGSELVNTAGEIAGANLKVDAGAGAIDNASGILAATGSLSTKSTDVDNRSGLLQAGDSIAIDATGGRFDNGTLGPGPTETSVGRGESTGGRVIGIGVELTAGRVDNTTGLMSTRAAMRVKADSVMNDAGTIVAAKAIDIESAAVSNIGGRIGSNAGVIVNGATLDNTRGAMHAGATLSVTADTIRNGETADAALPAAAGIEGMPAGLEGRTVVLHAEHTLSNTAGSIRTDENALLRAGNIDNVGGHIQSTGKLTLTASDTVLNTGGNVNAADELLVSSGILTNDGRLQSRGDLTVETEGAFENFGKVISDGNVTIAANRALVNHGTISAGDTASMSANSVRNETSGEIVGAAATKIHARGNVTNAGLIDAGVTVIEAKSTLANTGRIYGDRVSASATSITNGPNAQGVAGVIASRGDLDIGAQTVTNHGDALIYAGQDMAIGGALDARDRASGVAGRVTNRGAQIDAGRDLAVKAERFENLNANFQTGKQTSDEGRRVWYRLNGAADKIDPAAAYFLQIKNQTWSSDYRWGLQDDYHRLVLPSEAYPFEKFAPYTKNGTVGEVVPARTAAYTPYGTLAGGALYPPTYVSPASGIWETFDVAHPEPIPDYKPHREKAPLAGNAAIAACFESTDDACRLIVKWMKDNEGTYNALQRRIQSYNADLRSRQFREWTVYDVNVKATTDVVTATQQGKVFSGRHIQIDAPSAINDKSQIVAGDGVVLGVHNIAAQGEKTFTGEGAAIYTWIESGGAFRGDDRKTSRSPYALALPPMAIELPIATPHPANPNPVKAVALTAPVAEGTRGAPLSVASGKEMAGPNAVRPDDLLADAREAVANTGARVARTVQPDLRLPANALYRVVRDPGSPLLVETDPRFTNHKTWLSSDAMLGALKADPARTAKRIGDGFYEQQLIQQQIIQATAQRYVGDYTDNESQYRALLSNGIQAAKAFDLNVGTALTDAQMAALTSDIVWLVNETATLPDGSEQTVLVPKVYLRANSADVTGSGALIAGKNVLIDAKGSYRNAGTIASRNVTVITADSITNSGVLSGGTVVAQAKQDLSSLGGLIQGNTVLLSAGRDVNLSSTTSEAVTRSGAATGIDKVAAVNAGVLRVDAGRDVNAMAAAVSTDGDAFLNASNDVNLSVMRETSRDAVTWGDKNRAEQAASTDVGTQIATGGHLLVNAQRDVNMTAAYADAEGAIDVRAGRDVNLNAGQDSASALDEHARKERGILSTTSTHSLDSSSHANAIGTTLSSDTMFLQARNDLTAKGATIASTGDAELVAGRNLTVTTSERSSSEYHFMDVKKTGLGSAGAGISYGMHQTTDTSRDTSTGVQRGLIGSTDGAVHMQAGGKLHVTGADVVAAGDITGKGREVTIDAAGTKRHHDETHEMKSSGFTLAVKSPVLDALQKLNHEAKATGGSKNARAAALHGIAAAGSAMGVLGAGGAAAGALASGGKPEAKVELSFGASRSTSTFEENSTEHAGSRFTSGGTVGFVATGDGTRASGNVTIIGSEVNAKHVLLDAKHTVNLLSSADTHSTRSTNESRSASVGVSYGTGGFGVSASMARAHGDGNSDALTHNNTHIDARNGVKLVSGGDTNIVGANLNARWVQAEIGGDLNVASVQDTSRSRLRQQSTGGGFSVSQGGGSASFSHSRGNAQGSYAGVHEQTGIQAGEGGFELSVKGATSLKGAYIASTAPREKNRLRTGTLSWGDIENESSYSASSSGFAGGGAYGDGGMGYATQGPASGRNTGGVAPMLMQSESGEGHAVTRSAISPATIEVTDEGKQKQDLALLNRDTRGLNGTVSQIPDLQQLLSEQSDTMAAAQAAQAAGEVVAAQIGAYAQRKRAQAEAASAAATASGDVELAARYASEARDWKEGGANHVAMHAAGAALMAGLGGGNVLGGAAGAALASVTAGRLNEVAGRIGQSGATGNREVDQALGNIVANGMATVLGGAVGGNAGAVGGYGVDRFNRQLHQSEYDKAEQYAKTAAKKLGISEREAEGRIVAEMLRNSDKQTAEAAGGKHDYEIRGIVGCQNLNCAGYKNDLQYANHDYNSQYIEANQDAYDFGQKQIGRGVTYDGLVASNYDKDPFGNTIARAGGSLLTGSVIGGVAAAWGVGAAFTYAGDAISYQYKLSPDQPSYTNAAIAGGVAAGMSPLLLPLNTLGGTTGGKVAIGIYNSLVGGVGAFGTTAMTNPNSSPDLSAGIGAASAVFGMGGKSVLPGPVGKAFDTWVKMLPGPAQAVIENNKNGK